MSFILICEWCDF